VFPWGHLAVGYLLYSPVVHVWQHRRPEGLSVIVLAFATQLPDLVDKPLSWLFGVFPQGYSVGHSALFAVPITVVAIVIAARRGRTSVGVAFAVGHWSHLGADVFVATLFGNTYTIERVLYPLVVLPSYETHPPAIQRVLIYLLAYLEAVLLSGNIVLIAIYVGPLLSAVLLWLADGTPGLPRPGGGPDSRTRDRT